MSGNAEQVKLSPQAITAIAAACHAANAAFCRSLGDDSQPAWGDAPDWQVSSAINGVEFHLRNPDAGDAASHENWLKVKEAEGWKYGEKKDPEKKEHPCMVPFDKLPPEQQFKDALFRAIVHGTAPLLAPLEEENAQLKRSLSAQKGAATKARAAVAAAQPPKPRKFGPVKEQLGPRELAELIDGAEDVQVAFTDKNGREIAGLAPRTISGDAFQADDHALRLNVPEMSIHGPAQGSQAFRLGGYALLVDGDQVAFATRDELSIAAGQTYELKDDVAFMAAA